MIFTFTTYIKNILTKLCPFITVCFAKTVPGQTTLETITDVRHK